MSKLPKEDSRQKPQNKNIKNIYVHKINSLVKISRDSLGTDQIQIVHNSKASQKKIKKIYSEGIRFDKLVDKATLKLQKNRQSARKARQRKNLYIRLLQKQVQFLKQQLLQSQAVQNSSQKYLNSIKNSCRLGHKRSHSPTLEDDLDRYISQQNVTDIKQSKQRDERKLNKLDQVTSQIKHWFIPDLLKNISALRKTQRAQFHTKLLQNLHKQGQHVSAKSQQNQFQNHNHQELHHNEIPLRLLLPFEQRDNEQKITNIIKTLGKNSQQIRANLQNLTKISKQVKQLILEQENTKMDITQILRRRIKNLIQQTKQSKVGDTQQKIIERIIRWGQFPTINMHTCMHKIVQLNNFISHSNIDENGMKQIKQRADQSDMSEEKEKQLGKQKQN